MVTEHHGIDMSNRNLKCIMSARAIITANNSSARYR